MALKLGKLKRRGQPDVAQRTILRAVSMAGLGYLSPHMHRANIEIAVCAIRVEQQLAALDDRLARPCLVCGETEQDNHWRHIFLDCATAKMICLPGNNGDHGTTAGDHRITGAIEPAEERRKETDDETANQGHTIDSFGRTLDPLSPLLHQD